MKPCDPSAATAPEATTTVRCNLCTRDHPASVLHLRVPFHADCIPVSVWLVIDKGRLEARAKVER